MSTLIACATCRPEAGSLSAQAQDLAVLVMLGGLFFGMLFVGLIFFNLIRKQQRRAALADGESN